MVSDFCIKVTVMLRPVAVTLESLQVTLHKLEQTADPTQDAADLKRILLRRIAELEAAQAVETISILQKS